jgi:hypothetical protein
MNKAYKAFWACRGTFGNTSGLKPKVVYWIYTAVVRPIVTYAATIWWPRVKLKASQAELSKLQMACLGLTGAMEQLQQLQWKLSLDSTHCTSRWKWRPRYQIPDYVVMINGKLNSKLLDMHT